MSLFGNLFGGMLRQLYTFGSLRNTEDGFEFGIKNRLSSGQLTGIIGLKIDGEPIPLENITLILDDGRILQASDITEENAIPFPSGKEVTVRVKHAPLAPGKHEIGIALKSQPFGDLKFKVEDTLEA